MRNALTTPIQLMLVCKVNFADIYIVTHLYQCVKFGQLRAEYQTLVLAFLINIPQTVWTCRYAVCSALTMFMLHTSGCCSGQRDIENLKETQSQ